MRMVVGREKRSIMFRHTFQKCDKHKHSSLFWKSTPQKVRQVTHNTWVLHPKVPKFCRRTHSGIAAQPHGLCTNNHTPTRRLAEPHTHTTSTHHGRVPETVPGSTPHTPLTSGAKVYTHRQYALNRQLTFHTTHTIDKYRKCVCLGFSGSPSPPARSPRRPFLAPLCPPPPAFPPAPPAPGPSSGCLACALPLALLSPRAGGVRFLRALGPSPPSVPPSFGVASLVRLFPAPRAACPSPLLAAVPAPPLLPLVLRAAPGSRVGSAAAVLAAVVVSAAPPRRLPPPLGPGLPPPVLSASPRASGAFPSPPLSAPAPRLPPAFLVAVLPRCVPGPLRLFSSSLPPVSLGVAVPVARPRPSSPPCPVVLFSPRPLALARPGRPPVPPPFAPFPLTSRSASPRAPCPPLRPPRPPPRPSPVPPVLAAFLPRSLVGRAALALAFPLSVCALRRLCRCSVSSPARPGPRRPRARCVAAPLSLSGSPGSPPLAASPCAPPRPHSPCRPLAASYSLVGAPPWLAARPWISSLGLPLRRSRGLPAPPASSSASCRLCLSGRGAAAPLPCPRRPVARSCSPAPPPPRPRPFLCSLSPFFRFALACRPGPCFSPPVRGAPRPLWPTLPSGVPPLPPPSVFPCPPRSPRPSPPLAGVVSLRRFLRSLFACPPPARPRLPVVLARGPRRCSLASPARVLSPDAPSFPRPFVPALAAAAGPRRPFSRSGFCFSSRLPCPSPLCPAGLARPAPAGVPRSRLSPPSPPSPRPRPPRPRPACAPAPVPTPPCAAPALRPAPRAAPPLVWFPPPLLLGPARVFARAPFALVPPRPRPLPRPLLVASRLPRPSGGRRAPPRLLALPSPLLVRSRPAAAPRLPPPGALFAASPGRLPPLLCGSLLPSPSPRPPPPPPSAAPPPSSGPRCIWCPRLLPPRAPRPPRPPPAPLCAPVPPRCSRLPVLTAPPAPACLPPRFVPAPARVARAPPPSACPLLFQPPLSRPGVRSRRLRLAFAASCRSRALARCAPAAPSSRAGFFAPPPPFARGAAPPPPLRPPRARRRCPRLPSSSSPPAGACSRASFFPSLPPPGVPAAFSAPPPPVRFGSRPAAPPVACAPSSCPLPAFRSCVAGPRPCSSLLALLSSPLPARLLPFGPSCPGPWPSARPLVCAVLGPPCARPRGRCGPFSPPPPGSCLRVGLLRRPRSFAAPRPRPVPCPVVWWPPVVPPPGSSLAALPPPWPRFPPAPWLPPSLPPFPLLARSRCRPPPAAPAPRAPCGRLPPPRSGSPSPLAGFLLGAIAPSVAPPPHLPPRRFPPACRSPLSPVGLLSLAHPGPDLPPAPVRSRARCSMPARARRRVSPARSCPPPSLAPAGRLAPAPPPPPRPLPSRRWALAPVSVRPGAARARCPRRPPPPAVAFSWRPPVVLSVPSAPFSAPPPPSSPRPLPGPPFVPVPAPAPPRLARGCSVASLFVFRPSSSPRRLVCPPSPARLPPASPPPRRGLPPPAGPLVPVPVPAAPPWRPASSLPVSARSPFPPPPPPCPLCPSLFVRPAGPCLGPGALPSRAPRAGCPAVPAFLAVPPVARRPPRPAPAPAAPPGAAPRRAFPCAALPAPPRGPLPLRGAPIPPLPRSAPCAFAWASFPSSRAPPPPPLFPPSLFSACPVGFDPAAGPAPLSGVCRFCPLSAAPPSASLAAVGCRAASPPPVRLLPSCRPRAPRACAGTLALRPARAFLLPSAVLAAPPVAAAPPAPPYAAPRPCCGRPPCRSWRTFGSSPCPPAAAARLLRRAPPPLSPRARRPAASLVARPPAPSVPFFPVRRSAGWSAARPVLPRSALRVRFPAPSCRALPPGRRPRPLPFGPPGSLGHPAGSTPLSPPPRCSRLRPRPARAVLASRWWPRRARHSSRRPCAAPPCLPPAPCRRGLRVPHSASFPLVRASPPPSGPPALRGAPPPAALARLCVLPGLRSVAPRRRRVCLLSCPPRSGGRPLRAPPPFPLPFGPRSVAPPSVCGPSPPAHLWLRASCPAPRPSLAAPPPLPLPGVSALGASASLLAGPSAPALLPFAPRSSRAPPPPCPGRPPSRPAACLPAPGTGALPACPAPARGAARWRSPSPLPPLPACRLLSWPPPAPPRHRFAHSAPCCRRPAARAPAVPTSSVRWLCRPPRLPPAAVP